VPFFANFAVKRFTRHSQLAESTFELPNPQ
jgi:hypothetical protein